MPVYKNKSSVLNETKKINLLSTEDLVQILHSESSTNRRTIQGRSLR